MFQTIKARSAADAWYKAISFILEHGERVGGIIECLNVVVSIRPREKDFDSVSPKVDKKFVPHRRDRGLQLEDTEVVDVVGPVCEGADFFAKDRSLPPVKRGDIISIFTAGAYGFSMSSNYNARGRAAEVLVDSDKFSVIRKRETYEDLTALEK